jgi:hypothetical protein
MVGHILPLGSLSTEEHMMKRQWHIRRGTVRRPDAQGRWDQAYQSVLRWNLEAQRASSHPSPNGKEEYHAGGGLRVRVSTSRQVKLQTTLSSNLRG